MPRKILFVNPAGEIYGSERSMLSLLEHSGFQAVVACPPGGTLTRTLAERGVLTIPMRFGRYRLARNPIWHVYFLLRFVYLLYRVRPNAVVMNLDGNTTLVSLASQLACVPFVVFCRFEVGGQAVAKLAWRMAKVIICPSEVVKMQVLEAVGTRRRGAVHRLYDPCALLSPTIRGRYTGLTDGRISDRQPPRVLGCVGRIHPAKQQEIAIRALRILRDRGFDAKLLIVGSHDGSPDGERYSTSLQELAQELGLASVIEFLGARPIHEMSLLYTQMDILIHPSKSESFGLALSEAWAHGVPTVCSDVSGCREITKASGGGLLAPVGCAEDFAQRAADLLVDRTKASSCGEAGQRWVTSECSPQKYAQSFCQLMDTAC